MVGLILYLVGIPVVAGIWTWFNGKPRGVELWDEFFYFTVFWPWVACLFAALLVFAVLLRIGDKLIG